MEQKQTPEFYRFVSIYQGYLASTRDYGDGVLRTMSEVHILQIICREPGITIGGIAQQWGRTKGAASQNVTKLEKQDLVTRSRHPENAKEIHVYPTEAGLRLTALHEAYDAKTEKFFQEELLKRCSMEELITFTRVLGYYSDILEEQIK